MTNQEIISLNSRHSEKPTDTIDFEKLLHITRQSLFWILLFIVIGVSSAYLIIRYTKPVFESQSLIKLNFENEANTLGLVNNGDMQKDLNNISGEIEILMSNLFLSQAIKELDYDISYYRYGTYLVDERFNNNPFEISYLIKDPGFYDFPFDISINDLNKFELSYQIGELVETSIHNFGEEISNDRFNLLVDKLDLDKNTFGKYFFIINSNEGLINYLKGNLSVQPENLNAKTIRISLQDYNKYKAKKFVDIISNRYLSFTTESKNQAIIQKLDFLNTQIGVTEEKIEELEEYFEGFIIENKTVSLENDISQTIEYLNTLDTQSYALNNHFNIVSALQKQLSEDEMLQLNPFFIQQLPSFISAAINDYQEIVNERNRKIDSYNENTIIIRRLDSELSVTKYNLLELVNEYLYSLKNRIREIEIRKDNLQTSFVKLPSLDNEHAKQRRLYLMYEGFLSSLRQSKMDLEITKAGTVAKSIILSPASLPGIPVKPQSFLIIVIGFTLGLTSAIFFVLIRYLAHNKISSVRELERLTEVPIVGSVPFYTHEKLQTTRLIIDVNSKTAISESLRTIRTNLEFLRPREQTSFVTITSTISGEGKTFIAVNLGAIIASSNLKVCIVDLDMRKPKVHLAFGKEASNFGVSTILSGKSGVKESSHQTEIKNLFYIGAGPTPPNPSELILSKEFDELLNDLNKEYDLIILDTPPVGLVTDGVLAMKKSDLQIYVLKAEFSKQSFVKTIHDLQKINRFNNMTLLLNGVKSGDKGYGYSSYGYGYGYGYYEEKKVKKRLFNS